MCVNVHVNWPQMHMLRHVLGWGVGGSVSVHVNLPHMLRHVLGVCVCFLTFMLPCHTCTCFVTSGFPLMGGHW